MLLTQARGYILINRQIHPLPISSKDTSTEEFYFQHDLYEPSVDIQMLFLNLSHLNYPHPHFSLLYCETVLHPNFQLRVLKEIPEMYHPLLWVSALFNDLQDSVQLNKALNNCNMSANEWRMVSDIHSLDFEVSVPEIIQNIQRIFIEPVMILRIARALYFTESLLKGGDITHLVDRIIPNVDLVEFYLLNGTYGPIPRSTVTEGPLLLLNHSNIIQLLKRCSLITSEEYSEEVCMRITGLSRTQLRRSIIWNLWNCQEVSFKEFHPIDETIIMWYNKTNVNKLSTESLRELCNVLQKHPRKDWNNEKITMRFQMLVCPDYSFSSFCGEYDQSLHITREEELNTAIRKLGSLLEILGSQYHMDDPMEWPQFLDILENEHAFEIPILSPKGLLLIYDWTEIQVTSFLTPFLEETLMKDPLCGFKGIYNQRDDFS